MATVKRFEDLECWQEARKLAKHVHELTENDSFKRDFSLVNQIERAALSIMNNIAEGFDSGTKPEFRRFLSYSWRSCSEVQSCLYAALDRGYISEDQQKRAYANCIASKNLIAGLIRYLRRARRPLTDNISTSAPLHISTKR